MEMFCGRGRAVSTEVLAREARSGERTANRWIEGKAIPRLKHCRNIVASKILPTTFRKMVADYMLDGSADIRAVLTDAGEVPSESPMHISISMDEKLARLQRVLIEVTCPSSAGGKFISAGERARLNPEFADVELLACKLKRRIDSMTLKTAV
jgi:hypothetical protein